MFPSWRSSARIRFRYSRSPDVPHRVPDEEGAATVLLLAVIVFLSAAAVGAMVLLSSALRVQTRLAERAQRKETLEATARSVLTRLAADASPNEDSRFDSVWSYIAKENNSHTSLSLEDISSRLNLNLLRTAVLQKTSLRSAIAPGHTADGLRQYRATKGPFASLSAYSAYIVPDALHKDFTVFGYVNVNTTFEDSLRQVFQARTGDRNAADAFHSQIQAFLMKKKLIQQAQLRQLFGLYYPELYPLMNLQPSINVNFAPAAVLRAILSYPYGGKQLPGWQQVLAAVVAERASAPITHQDLTGMIHVSGEQELILQYLGTRTWFWRITASRGAARDVLIAARIPGGKEKRFVILQNHFTD